MRSFETFGLLCCGRNKESLCLNFGVSSWALGLGLGLGFGLAMPEAARAACVSTPDCESLGYTATSCVSGGVKCPWDTSKMFCGCGDDFVYSCSGTGYSGGVGGACSGKYASCTCASGYDWNGSSCIVCDSAYKYTCTGEGYSGGSGTACGGKYTACTCASGYFWKDSRCAQVCSVGQILYSDMSCSTDLVSGKTPIGVVSYVNGSTRIAIQLDDPGTMYWSSSSGTCAYQDISGIPNYTDPTSARTDFNGKSNTAAYISVYGSSCGSYASGYCNSYSKGGVSGWYLPAAGELYASVVTNYSTVNSGISAAGGTTINGDGCWSSSEYVGSYAWFVGATNCNNACISSKDGSVYVRCVLAF